MTPLRGGAQAPGHEMLAYTVTTVTTDIIRLPLHILL